MNPEQLHNLYALCDLAVQKFPEAARSFCCVTAAEDEQREAFSVLCGFVSSHWDRQIGKCDHKSSEQVQATILVAIASSFGSGIGYHQVAHMLRTAIPVEIEMVHEPLDRIPAAPDRC